MKKRHPFTVPSLFLILFFCLALFDCSKKDDSETPEDNFELTGNYCLDFSIMGSQMVIEKSNTSGVYNVEINDFDGGLRSGTGTGSVTNETLRVTGQISTEQGNASFEVTLSISESDQTLSGIFNVLNPQGVSLFNSSIRAKKGSCSFELSPEDVQNIIGQPYLSNLHVELDKIEKISKYRSAAGHNFVDYSGENCVNLKHYFQTFDEGIEPASSELPSSLLYFAPANGTIVSIGQARPSQDPTDYEIDIKLEANENIIVRLFHLTPETGIELGATVSSGQLVGRAPTAHLGSGDFAVYILTNQGYRHISMFEIMNTNVLSEYISRGIDSNWRQDLYYETTDQYPSQITCENGTFGNLRHPASRYELDFFILEN